jgi:hypothetical protein
VFLIRIRIRSALDGAWIRIWMRIRIQEVWKKELKGRKKYIQKQIIRHKKYKSNIICTKQVKCDFIYIKSLHLFCLTNFFLCTGTAWIRNRMDTDSFSKLDPDPHKVDADPKHCLMLLQWIEFILPALYGCSSGKLRITLNKIRDSSYSYFMLRNLP